MSGANKESMNEFVKTFPNRKLMNASFYVLTKHHVTASISFICLPHTYSVFTSDSPEHNPLELIRRELRVKYLNNKTFNKLDEVDKYVVMNSQKINIISNN